MNSIKFLKIRIFLNKISAKLIFFILGIASTCWFLIRIIPKPSRASYPCMRAAAPIMSGFIIYLTSLSIIGIMFKKAKKKFLEARYFLAFSIAALAISFSAFYFLKNAESSFAYSYQQVADTPNEPIGVPQGINPGRVVWVYNPDATNENYVTTKNSGDYWFDDTNTNQGIIEKMMSDGLKKLTGDTTTSNAWTSIFKYFNNKHGNGDNGYTNGDKIFIKINLTNSCCLSKSYSRMDATPQAVLALLKELIDSCDIPQADISLGDPYRTFRDQYWDKCHSVFPNVNYYDGNGLNGRKQTQPSADDILIFSDGQFQSRLPQAYLDAKYFINMPCLKTHNEGGITIGAKAHQGSIIADGDDPSQQSAQFMHYSLPGDDQGMGKYRHTVDYLGHKDLGGKTILTLVDGIWAGDNWEGNIVKWNMAPFNNDYPSSLLLSQDVVAIESVCYDFLVTENMKGSGYALINGAQDYMHQAADPANWPATISYDPEGDGSNISSLGVHEHWNNSTNKQYSVNLGIPGGLQLFTVPDSLVNSNPLGINQEKINNLKLICYPNPATDYVNFKYYLSSESNIILEIYNVSGQQVACLKNAFETSGEHEIRWNFNTSHYALMNGTYCCVLKININNFSSVHSIPFQIMK